METSNQKPLLGGEWIIKESKWFKVSYSLAEDKMKQVYF